MTPFKVSFNTEVNIRTVLFFFLFFCIKIKILYLFGSLFSLAFFFFHLNLGNLYRVVHTDCPKFSFEDTKYGYTMVFNIFLYILSSLVDIYIVSILNNTVVIKLVQT